jgi:hypothetical protein
MDGRDGRARGLAQALPPTQTAFSRPRISSRMATGGDWAAVQMGATPAPWNRSGQTRPA